MIYVLRIDIGIIEVTIMEIRKATINDLAAIAELEAVCFPPAEAAKKEAFESRLKVFADYFWLLFKDEKLIGMINGMVTDIPKLSDDMFEDATMHDENGAWLMIFGVATLPEYRKQGCASMIMKHVISDVKIQGRKGLVLTCKAHLVHFYEEFGFVSEGVSASVHGGAVWYDMRLAF